jgi:apolipoprotein D and lipocalin family protein
MTMLIAEELPTVQEIDLKKYCGTWYEIASIPNRFQKNCFATTATYELRENGDLTVVNKCNKGRLDGDESVATGKAWVSIPPAKLRVQFFWPFSGKYWILDLGKEYEYAIVGEPDKKYLWILSRKPKMDEKLYSALTEKIKSWGYDLSKLQKTPQK